MDLKTRFYDLVAELQLDYFQAAILCKLLEWKTDDNGGLLALMSAQTYLDEYIARREQFITTPLLRQAVVSDTCQCGHAMDEHNDQYGCTAVIDEDGGSRPCPCEVGMEIKMCVGCGHVEHEPGPCTVSRCACIVGCGEEHNGVLCERCGKDKCVCPSTAHMIVEEEAVEQIETATPAPRCPHCSHFEHSGACDSTHCECYTTQGGEPNAAETRARTTNCPSCHHPTRLHITGLGCIHRLSETVVCNCPVVY